MTATAPVLQLDKLTKKFANHTAVEEASFDVFQGDIFGFLGPNGAGKSTTLYMIAGLVHPTSGNVRIFGKPHSDFMETRSKTGFLIETPAFYDYLSGYRNLQVLARLQNITDRKHIDETLDMVGLLQRARDRVGSYSHGMKQRLGIAQALLGKPRLLVLDEPTNGLDPEGSVLVWDLLRRIVRETGTTVLISSHLLHEVEEGCNRIAVINQGIIVACDSVNNLLFFSKQDMLYLFDTAEKHSRAMELVSRNEAAEVVAVPDDMHTPRILEENAMYVRLQLGVATEFLEQLVASGAVPSAVIPQKKTLRQFFLELTRRQPGARGSESLP